MLFLAIALMLVPVSAVALSEEPAGTSLTPSERDRVTKLMAASLEAGRRQADEARSSKQMDAFDRDSAQARYALMLFYAGGCQQAVQFVRERPELLASRIKTFISAMADAPQAEYCVVELAALMLERWNDPNYSRGGRIAQRFIAAAWLDASGKSDARAIRDAADNDLRALPDLDALWDVRWEALNAYENQPGFMPYLDYLADRMTADQFSPLSTKRRSLLALFAARGRCDLVDRVEQNGLAGCQQHLDQAQGLYVNHRLPEEVAKGLREMAAAEAPSLEETALASALAEKNPNISGYRLLGLVKACAGALSARR